MSVFELATLRFKPECTSLAAGHLHDFMATCHSGLLVGCWRSEISRQNLILVLRRFESIDKLFAHRTEMLESSDPFGCAALLADMSLEAYAPFPGFEEVPPGRDGPYYEFRSYQIPPAGIGPTVAAWSEIVPRRSEVSRPAIIMFGLDGKTRFLHVWPYASLAERQRLREDALARGVWPPASAPRWLTKHMRSEIFMPTEISPLQ
jgi:hypothetical protein